MVYPSIGNTPGVLEQLCAHVRAETWGRAATAPGCLSAHGHGTWGVSMAQDRAAGCLRDVYTVLCTRLGCLNGRRGSEGSTKPGQAEPELVHGLTRHPAGHEVLKPEQKGVRTGRGHEGCSEKTIIMFMFMLILVRLYVRPRQWKAAAGARSAQGTHSTTGRCGLSPQRAM